MLTDTLTALRPTTAYLKPQRATAQPNMLASSTVNMLPSAMRDAVTCFDVSGASGCVCHLLKTTNTAAASASHSGSEDLTHSAKKPPAVRSSALVTT